MENTKLVLLLKSLTTRERTRFGHYVYSPFFNRHEKLCALYDWLNRFAPDFDLPADARQSAWRAMYPARPYDELRLNNFISNLLQLLYGFLARLQYEQQPLQERLYLFDELLSREQEKHLPGNKRRAQQLLEEEEGRSYLHHLRESQLAQQLDRMELQRQQRRFTEHLQHENDALELYFWVNKLRIACEMASRQAIFKAGYRPHFMDFIRAEYKAYSHLAGSEALAIYLKALDMLEQRDQSTHFFQLKALLEEQASALPQDERNTLYHYTLNYCISRINNGEEQFYQQIFQLYQAMLQSGLMMVHGQLSQFSFKNITTTALRLKEFDWAESFIEQYQAQLPEEKRENAVAYNSAALWYAQGHYKKALRVLQNVEFTDASYHLGVKIIQLKSYYELDEAEAFYALLEAFKKYLLRHASLSDFRIKANANFLLLARRIFQLKEQEGFISDSKFTEKEQKLRQQLQKTEPLANKSWLVDALGRLARE